jgi:hypothetical protein
MKTFFTFLFLITSFFYANSQQLIASSGEFFSNPGGSICFSIGEPIIATFEGNNAVLTQGIHQPQVVTQVAISHNLLDLIDIQVFPNPFSDYLYINISKFDFIDSYQLFDNSGHFLLGGSIFTSTSKLSLSSIPTASYILLIFDKKHRLIYSAKLVKTKMN